MRNQEAEFLFLFNRKILRNFYPIKISRVILYLKEKIPRLDTLKKK